MILFRNDQEEIVIEKKLVFLRHRTGHQEQVLITQSEAIYSNQYNWSQRTRDYLRNNTREIFNKLYPSIFT